MTAYYPPASNEPLFYFSAPSYMSPELKCKQNDKLPVFINCGKHRTGLRPAGHRARYRVVSIRTTGRHPLPRPSPLPLPPQHCRTASGADGRICRHAVTPLMSVFEMRVTNAGCLAPQSKVNGCAAYASVSPKRHYWRDHSRIRHFAASRRCQTLTLCYSYAYCTVSVIAVGIQRRRGRAARRRGASGKTARAIHSTHSAISRTVTAHRASRLC